MAAVTLVSTVGNGCNPAATPGVSSPALPRPIPLKRHRMPASWHEQKNDRVLASALPLQSVGSTLFVGTVVAQKSTNPHASIEATTAAAEPLAVWRSVLRADDYFSCLVAGCGTTFASVAALCAHVAAEHMHRCHSCGLAFLRARWAMIHAQEQHPSALFLALVARGEPMFECWVDSCSQRFADAIQRQRHMRIVHHMPTAYFNLPRLTAALQQAEGSAAAVASVGACGRDAAAALDACGAAGRALPQHALAQRVCSFFNTRGGCRNGSACRFAHVRRERPLAGAPPHAAADDTAASASAAAPAFRMTRATAVVHSGMAMDSAEADAAEADGVATAAAGGASESKRPSSCVECKGAVAPSHAPAGRAAAPMFAPHSVAFGRRRGGARLATSPGSQRCTPGPAFRASPAIQAQVYAGIDGLAHEALQPAVQAGLSAAAFDIDDDPDL